MNRYKSVEIFHIEMLDHIINTTFSSIRKFEPFDRYTTLARQLQDGLMGPQESHRMRFVVRKLWDLKLQIHMIEKEDAQLTYVIGHIITLMLDLHLARLFQIAYSGN